MPTSRKRSPKDTLSPGSTRISALEPLAFEIIDFTPGDLVCKKE
jgi:hypothetical protein